MSTKYAAAAAKNAARDRCSGWPTAATSNPSRAVARLDNIITPVAARPAQSTGSAQASEEIGTGRKRALDLGGLGTDGINATGGATH